MISNTVVQQCCFYFNKLISLDTWKRIQWMNKKAPPQEAYNPTPIEHVANVITHGVWILPSILATLELLERSHNGAQTLSALVYGATLVFLFSISTSFHCSFFCNKRGKLKDVLHRCDRAMIYVFIAGSYFPWLTLEQLPKEGWASSMHWFVWFLAVLGIIYQQTFHERYKSLETCFYLVMGIGPGLLVICEVRLPLVPSLVKSHFQHEFSGLTEVKVGGALYVVGVMFFKSDGIIPCAHAIWHLFVVMAAGVHYYAIRNNLYPTDSHSNRFR
jgi:monocyte-to-macrophage differentiation protein